MLGDERRRNKIHHHSRNEHDEFVRVIVGSEHFARGENVHRVKAKGKVEKTREARKRKRKRLGKHQADEEETSPRKTENRRAQSGCRAKCPGGKGAENHGKRDPFDALHF